MWQKLRSLISQDRHARRLGERDAPTDTGEAAVRPEHEPYVGRAGSDDAIDAEPSGAEIRGDGDLDQQGAARPD
jgi:hypothetical protein